MVEISHNDHGSHGKNKTFEQVSEKPVTHIKSDPPALNSDHPISSAGVTMKKTHIKIIIIDYHNKKILVDGIRPLEYYLEPAFITI